MEQEKEELIDLIQQGTTISTEEAIKDVTPIDWSEDVLAGKYRDQTIVTTPKESGGMKKQIKLEKK